MLVFNIKGSKEKINLPEHWQEISLEKYGNFINAIQELQKVLKEEDKDETNLFDIILNHRKEFNKVFCSLTGVKSDIVDNIKASNLATIYLHIKKFLEPPKKSNIESFIFNDVEYFLPKSKSDYFGNVFPMAEATFGEIVEAMQIKEMSDAFIDNNYLALPYQIAILCRPKGEEYNDSIINKRAEMFKGLSMDVVWQIAFFLIKHKNKSMSLLSQYLTSQKTIMEA